VKFLAKYEIPHSECVAIGIIISSFFAHLKETLSRSNLKKILNCILDMGLSIYVIDYDCCNANILWAKIRTKGIEHKDEML
jgi:3-dehydroquinate synthetase